MDFELWIETEHVEGRIEDFCNVLVTLQTGEAYGLNVWTFAFFAVARRQGEETTSGDIAERYPKRRRRWSRGACRHARAREL